MVSLVYRSAADARLTPAARLSNAFSLGTAGERGRAMNCQVVEQCLPTSEHKPDPARGEFPRAAGIWK
jgi:hypothetical protein